MSDISGVVKDQSTGLPLANISVELWKLSDHSFSGVKDITDSGGNYNIVNSLLDNPDIYVRYIDPSNAYGDYSITATNGGSLSGATDTADVTLSKNSMVAYVPWYVWVILIVVVLSLIYFRKYLK